MGSKPREAKIRVVVVDDILETRENLKKLLYFEDDIEIVGAAGNGREGVELVGRLEPDVVLMDINMPGMDGIAASEAITEKQPNVQIIMMSVQGESDYLRRSMLAGAREFLIKPFSSEELTTSIRRVHQLAAMRRVAVAPPAAPAPETLPQPKPAGGKVIVVYSPKGGVGVSTIAVNLALALHDVSKGRVALVDASLQFGDAGLLLNLPGQRTIADAVGNRGEIDDELLNRVCAAHSSGIRVLMAPPRPELAELVTPEVFRTILRTLSRSYDYILVDTPKPLGDLLLAAFDEAEQILLVATGDIATLKNCKLFFDVTQALGYADQKVVLVVNRDDGRGVIPLRDIESNIKHPVALALPRDDRLVTAALNRGVPFLVSQRSAALSVGILRLARMLMRPEPALAAAPPTPATQVSRPAAPPESQPARRSRFSFGRK